MSTSQHTAIDLTASESTKRVYKRKLNFQELQRKRESENAIDRLLGDRLKSFKLESKDAVKDEPDVSRSSGEAIPRNSISFNNPKVEWWDEAILGDPGAITHLIEHPVPLKGTTALSKQSVLAKAMLTPAESEKLRKLRKKEKVQDMQDKIKMGLLKAPPPKIKMKNLMLVLGKEAVAGPSAVEQMVRAQVEQRLRDHEQRNEERKLSPEERRAKNIAKWTRPLDKASVLKLSVYLIFTEIHNKVRFKISKNAEQLHLGGIFLNSKLKRTAVESAEYYPSLVVVEGSRKAVKRFDRLMLNRINWEEKIEDQDERMVKPDEEEEEEAEDEDEEEGSVAAGLGTVCVRIFHGSVSKKKFNKWSYQELRNYSEGMNFLMEKECMHFWAMVDRFRNQRLDV